VSGSLVGRSWQLGVFWQLGEVKDFDANGVMLRLQAVLYVMVLG